MVKRQNSVYKEISTARCYQVSSNLVVEKHSLDISTYKKKKDKLVNFTSRMQNEWVKEIGQDEGR